MKLLVSGATGFIGFHLTKRLARDGHRVVALVRRTTNANELKAPGVAIHRIDRDIDDLIAFLKKGRFDGVIHLASLFLVNHNPKQAAVLVETNVRFSTFLLEAAAQSRIPFFLNTGTFWQHYRDREYSPVNLYAATKQAFEDIARWYVETRSINFVTLQLSDTFGPNDPRPKLLATWKKNSASGESMDMSPGRQRLDISYIDNVVDAYVRLIALLRRDAKRKLSGRVFALKTTPRPTLRELAATFESVTHRRLNIRWGRRPYRNREVMIPWSKGKVVPSWKPRVSIREGIRRMTREGA